MSGWMCFALMLPGEPFSPPMCLARRSRLAGPRNLAGCCVCTPAQNRFLGPLWRQQATGPTFSKGDVSLLCCLRLSKHHAREVKFVLFFFPSPFLVAPGCFHQYGCGHTLRAAEMVPPSEKPAATVSKYKNTHMYQKHS